MCVSILENQTKTISSDFSSVEEDMFRTLWQTNQPKFMEVVFHRFYTPLGRTVNRMLQDTAATEDIVQEVFVKVWHSRDTIQFNYSVRAYLYRAAINLALNYLEKNKRLQLFDLQSTPEPFHTDVEDQFNLQEAETHIEDALNSLPPACKAVFVLSRYEDMTYREIADSLQLSPKTVENQMGKALRLLREYMRGYTRTLLLLF